MGAPKQKWTPEEEAALRAGVEKHGLGKWRAIQKDPEFAFCLATRSNVDLKDKWRNLNVGVGTHGSRDAANKRAAKNSLARAIDDCMSLPSTPTSEDLSIEDTDSAADAFVSMENIKGRKAAGPRLSNLILEAISELNDPNSCNVDAIVSFIEARHCVVSDNFMDLVKTKLKELVGQGKLVKVKRNYVLNSGNQQFQEALHANVGKRERGMLPNYDLDSPTSRASKGNIGVKMARLDFGFVQTSMKTHAEAVRIAALLVAEAEAAAIAAEKAANEAETAEAEAEAAEIAAEIAILNTRKGKLR